MGNTYVYVVGNSVYINLTNRCSNRCKFCVRSYDKPIYGDLWIKSEPTAKDVIDILEKEYDLSKYKDVVFCGFGEPTYRFDAIKEIAAYVHSKGAKTRINTNGHGNKINNRDISKEMAECIDVINVSLNEVDKYKYQDLCQSIYKEEAFDIMLDFAKKTVEAGGNVILSVVDCIGEEDIKKAYEIADSIGAKLRVRELIEDESDK